MAGGTRSPRWSDRCSGTRRTRRGDGQMPNHWCDRSIRWCRSLPGGDAAPPRRRGGVRGEGARGADRRPHHLRRRGDLHGGFPRGDELHRGLPAAGRLFSARTTGTPSPIPWRSRTATRTLAEKAGAYGLPGVRVDGNDVLAVRKVVGDAMDRARAGEGGTLIEAPRTASAALDSDDPTGLPVGRGGKRPGRGKDPIRTVRPRSSKGKGLLDDPAVGRKRERRSRARGDRGGGRSAPRAAGQHVRGMSTRRSRGTSPSSGDALLSGKG